VQDVPTQLAICRAIVLKINLSIVIIMLNVETFFVLI
jgi:hypothetical protein